MAEFQNKHEAQNKSVEAGFILVGTTDEFKVGDIRQVCAPGIGPIAVFHTENGFYALADKCSHGEAMLSDGWLEGCEIECPFHGGRFDVRTGEALSFPVTEDVARYETRILDGRLLVVKTATD